MALFGLRARKLVCFLAFVAALALSRDALAQSTDELVGELQKRLPASNNPVAARYASFIGPLKGALADGQFGQVEEYLQALKAGLGNDEKAAALVDQLLATIHAQTAVVEKKRDGEIEAVLGEAAAKFMARAPAVDFDGLLKRLASLPVVQGQRGDQRLELARRLVTTCQDYLMATEHDQAEQASNALNQLIQMSAGLTVIPRSALLGLQAQAMGDSTKITNEANARFDVLKQKVVETVDSAKSAADFDPILLEITQMGAQGVRRTNRYQVTTTIDQLEPLRRFIQRWQEYFSQAEAGHGVGANNALTDLLNDSNTELFYPRSRILTRLNGKPKAAILVAAVTAPPMSPDSLTIDNLEEFDRQLSGLSGSDPSIQPLSKAIDRLLYAANQVKIGYPEPAITIALDQNLSFQTGRYSLAIGRIQQAVLTRAMPAYIGAPADLKPLDQESADAYMQRVAARGRELKDWLLVYRALNERRAANPQLLNTFEFNAEIEGYRQFFIGMNMERAEQWVQAIRAYLAALQRDESADLPAEEIGARLRKLKAAHPRDYEEAETPVYADMRRGFSGQGFPSGNPNAANGAFRLPAPLPAPPAAETAAGPATPAAKIP